MHARRTQHPLLDPHLFRHKLFRSAVIGGSFFRIGVGAVPFLLPLMLQLGFGMTPFQSGAITFVSAIGAIMSKFLAEKVYARFGFPRTLGFASFFGGVLIAAQGLFDTATPVLVIMVVLLLGGVLRSVFFTGANALGYADVGDAVNGMPNSPRELASQATAIVAVAQQLSVAFGVAVAGAILEASTQMRGSQLQLVDFQIAFFVVGGLSALAGFIYWRLPVDAGSNVSGHKAMATQKE